MVSKHINSIRLTGGEKTKDEDYELQAYNECDGDAIDGIVISFNQNTKVLTFAGWYDGNCPLHLRKISLEDFLTKLRIRK